MIKIAGNSSDFPDPTRRRAPLDQGQFCLIEGAPFPLRQIRRVAGIRGQVRHQWLPLAEPATKPPHQRRPGNEHELSGRYGA